MMCLQKGRGKIMRLSMMKIKKMCMVFTALSILI